MNSRLHQVLDAALPAAFVATVAGTCFSGADYLLLMAIEDFAEMLGWLPPGWEDIHRNDIYITVALTTLVVTIAVGWWMYLTARRSMLEHDTHSR